MKIIENVDEVLSEAEAYNNKYKYVTIDFFIMGVNCGKIRSGSGFKYLGVSADGNEINIIFPGSEVLSLPIRHMQHSFEKINNTRFPTLVLEGQKFKMYITWS